MKKVLIIAGSPRLNGNSEILCDEFKRGAEESGNYVEKITLRNQKIGYCIACDYCVTHNGECAIKDDMKSILEKIIEFDVLVLASPVYFYSVDAQIKAMIDRSVARYTEIRNKELYYIMTAADNDIQAFDGSIACFRGYKDCIENAVEKGIICGGGAWKSGDIKHTEAMHKAYEMGRNV